MEGGTIHSTSPIRAKRTIAFVTPSFHPSPGGLAVAGRRVTGYLRDEGWTVHVVTPAEGQDAAAANQTGTTCEEEILVHRFAADPASADFLQVWKDVLTQLDDVYQFDLFHAFFLVALYPCVRVAARNLMAAPRKVIGSIRGSDITYLGNSAALPFFLFCLRRIQWLTSVSMEYLQQAIDVVPELRGCSSVIRNGVHPPQESWSALTDSRVLGMLGQFRAVKNAPLLIRAYASLPTNLRGGLRLGGYFLEEKEELWSRALIGEFGISSEVEVTGHLPHAEIAKFLQSLYIYVQPSSAEGLPNAVLEAAAFGLPIVATSVGGMREVFTHESNALLVPPGRPEQMRDAIARLLRNQELCIALSEGARELAASLSWEEERRHWISLYERLFEERHTGRSQHTLGISAQVPIHKLLE